MRRGRSNPAGSPRRIAVLASWCCRARCWEGSRSFSSGGFGCLIGRVVGLAGVGMFKVEVVWVLWLLSLRNRRSLRRLTRVVGLFEPPLARAKVSLLLFLMLG